MNLKRINHVNDKGKAGCCFGAFIAFVGARRVGCLSWSGFINPGPKSFGSAIRVRNARDEHPRGLQILNSRIQDRRSGPTEILAGVNMSEKAQNNLWLYTPLGGENETESRSIGVRS